VKREKRINQQRRRRCLRVRNAVKRNSTRPRLSVFRSLKHIYAQIIDDDQGKTLVAASTLDEDLRGQIAYGGNCDAARVVGKAIAERAVQADIKQVAFDRREYRYHGRVAALADAARDAGLDLGPKKEVPAKEPAKGETKKKAKSKKSK
jgi:large subunit ribosomal protein L18